MVDLLVLESTRTEEGSVRFILTHLLLTPSRRGTGICLEYLLKNDVLGTLVRLSETDRPSGIQAEVLRAVQNMFLVHSVIHKAVLRLLRNCAGDDIQEQLDNQNRKVMGAAKSIVRRSPSEYEEDLVNLLCILCSRIRTFRELLMIFLHDKHGHHSEPLFAVEEEEEEEEEDAVDHASDSKPRERQSETVVGRGDSNAETPEVPAHTKKSEYEFLLFNYLLRFVHREGQIGDFARAGLLFLMDVAMSPGDQEHRLSKDESILSESASATGLGAVYSQLPSKLEVHAPAITDDSRGTSMILGGHSVDDKEAKSQAAIREKNRALGMEDSRATDFKSRLDHFLKLLEFLEDIFRRNTLQENSESEAIRQTFLENVLYPSILECSDADGSAVAVMSYIEIMIRTLERGQFTDLLVNFLVSEIMTTMLTLGSGGDIKTQDSDTQSKLRRRRSSAMILLELEAPESTKQSGYFTSLGRFTLKDLLISNLRSKDRYTAAAASQLLNTLLLYYSPLCADKLLIVARDPRATSFPEPALNDALSDNDDFVYPGETLEASLLDPGYVQPRITYSTHEREMDLYLKLVTRLDPIQPSDSFSTGYDRYLGDAIQAIQNHSSFSLTAIPKDVQAQMKHQLDPNDPILSSILEWLRKLFSNSPEFNVALTGVLASLAHDPFRSLDGWLTFGQLHNASSTIQPLAGDSGSGTQEDGDDKSADYRIEEMLASESTLPAPSQDDGSRPVILAIFQSLVTQVERYRHSVENIEKYLLERRQGLLFSENLTDALTLALDLEDTGSGIFHPPVPATSPVSGSSPKSAPRKSASLVSFLKPRKPKSEPLKTTQVMVESGSASSKNLAASPFGSHYQYTGAITVEPFEAPSPSEGPWIPARPLKFSAEEEDVFSSGWEEKSRNMAGSGSRLEEPAQSPKTVTLSRLLDNIVILEESIKEMAAIIQARRSLGIDGVRYV
ncbi:Retinoic acid induced 16-like protein-domain-containing protein [Multifurca ochricompacta]|uniref:Retinoic acid induced 16-like protein-domain-containing protein n=1 Tax=Multifurca ochricompacta TaxID=376703 RepID=A0AAD4MCI4_9AGAM|nr:Retinoic acid induced 16-like protein-domain-containing protein [Multifurca ochricompacta]